MTEAQWRQFLLERPRTAQLATVKSDGSPHVAPIWIDMDDDGKIIFNTGRATRKGKAIRRDPRVCLCVDDDAPPFSFVVIEGTAETTEDPNELLRSATRIAARYMGADQAEEYGRRNGVPGEMLVRVTPTKVIAHAALAD
ncbi:MAG: PPOX class F420-dependent oxidoreductase [Actinomycetota bacterium]